ncbi:MAG: ABC transporter ATP-binding protein/permease [Deltaproteobacteria bacterium]|nr:ABC transporter ATP-binding protein/permease [Deltaproteobacteria bacterium]
MVTPSSPPSRPPRLLALRALGPIDVRAVALELAPKALIPATLLSAGRASETVTLGLALAAQAFVVARGLWLGWALEARLVEAWSRLAAAGLDRPLASLARRSARMQGSMLVFAAQREAQLGASIAPRLVADAAGLALVALATGLLLGGEWLLAGLAVGLLAAPLVVAVTSRLRRAEDRGYDEVAQLVERCGVLVDGALEVRAHGLGPATVARAREDARRTARARREATALRALSTLAPVALVALLAATPTLRGALDLQRAWLPAAVLGTSGLACALGLVGSLGELAAAARERTTFREFVGPLSTQAPEFTSAPTEGASFRLEEIHFDGVSVRHERSARATPAAFSARWKTQRGLALVGENGAGKSTLVAALLGLVPLEAGAFWLDGAPWTAALAAQLRARVAFLPQRPFVAPARSVAWHLRLFADGVDDTVLEAALAQVGLLRVLQAQADGSPLEVAVGSLSGGERARLHLARVLLPRDGRSPAMIVVDEPEAGLDAEGRHAVRELLERLSAETPVLLVAHDEAVIPESFTRARCVGGV